MRKGIRSSPHCVGFIEVFVISNLLTFFIQDKSCRCLTALSLSHNPYGNLQLEHSATSACYSTYSTEDAKSPCRRLERLLELPEYYESIIVLYEVTIQVKSGSHHLSYPWHLITSSYRQPNQLNSFQVAAGGFTTTSPPSPSIHHASLVIS